MVQDRVKRAQRVCIRWSPGLSRSSFALNPGLEHRFRKTASPYRATVDPGSESDPLFTRNKLDLNHVTFLIAKPMRKVDWPRRFAAALRSAGVPLAFFWGG